MKSGIRYLVDEKERAQAIWQGVRFNAHLAIEPQNDRFTRLSIANVELGVSLLQSASRADFLRKFLRAEAHW